MAGSALMGGLLKHFWPSIIGRQHTLSFQAALGKTAFPENALQVSYQAGKTCHRFAQIDKSTLLLNGLKGLISDVIGLPRKNAVMFEKPGCCN